jgi:CitMHS family citrate-Mg2+:H+ or citrate-Ca2+:H+ symporter
MPLSLLFDPDSFYFGVLPVVSEAGGSLGMPTAQIGQAAILGQRKLNLDYESLSEANPRLIY